MILDLDDEELSDVREALRLQLLRMLKDLARAETPRAIRHLRVRYERLESIYRKCDRAAVTGQITATH